LARHYITAIIPYRSTFIKIKYLAVKSQMLWAWFLTAIRMYPLSLRNPKAFGFLDVDLISNLSSLIMRDYFSTASDNTVLLNQLFY
jgi:hypothetical protein